MNETEDRLTDALHAAARTVTAPSLRPLEDHPAPRHVPAGPRRRGHRWLAATASAAAVALIAGLAVAVSGRGHTRPAAGPGGLPRYYADEGWEHQPLKIRATATGQVTAVLPPGPGGTYLAVATGDDRVFYADHVAPDGVNRIYRFRVTAAGQVAGLAPVPGGDLGRIYVPAMAASPSGSQLAVVVQRFSRTTKPDQIIVLGTRTGARTTWVAGQAPPGQNPRSLRILQLSWTGDGRELAYLATWFCQPVSTHSDCSNAGPINAYEEVRTLNPAGPGGSLSSARLLLQDPGGDISAAAISPDGSVLTAVRVRGPHKRIVPRLLIVTEFDARTGRRLGILYRMTTTVLNLVSAFVPGPSGQYLILVRSGRGIPGVNGWIAGGRLHPLAPAAAGVLTETW
jgi:hypothetical protein